MSWINRDNQLSGPRLREGCPAQKNPQDEQLSHGKGCFLKPASLKVSQHFQPDVGETIIRLHNLHLHQRIPVDHSCGHTRTELATAQHALKIFPVFHRAKKAVGFILLVTDPELMKIRTVLPDDRRDISECIPVAGPVIAR